MGADCHVRFANGLGSNTSLDITVYYKTKSTDDEILEEKIHIDGANYKSLAFSFLVKVHRDGAGTALVDLDSRAFDGQPAPAYFNTRWGYAGDWGHYYLEWASDGVSRGGWKFE